MKRSYKRVKSSQDQQGSNNKGELMNEVKRFMRYTLPGLVSVILLILLTAVSNWSSFITNKALFTNKSFAGIIIGALLASGVLGNIYSVVYWAWFWHNSARRATDYRPCIRFVKDKVEIWPTANINKWPLSRKDAWHLVTAYWYIEKIDSNSISGADEFLNRMSDIVHGQGTSAVGIMAAFLGWMVLHYVALPMGQALITDGIIIIVWILIFMVNVILYNKSHDAFERIVNITFRDFIEKNYCESNRFCMYLF
jgi:hypothetical protein